MKYIIAGGSGLIGSALTRALLADGHDVVVLSRASGGSGPGRRVQWQPDGTAGPWASELNGAHAVFNLAGAGVADKRWTTARKHELIDSRLTATRSLVAAISEATPRPAVLVSSSAIGYYGTSETETFDESSPQHRDFLARLCINWESEATQAQNSGCRVVIMRSGLVLSKAGGALKKMLLPFQIGLGGPLGSGRQIMSWIHIDDWVRLARWAIDTPAIEGAINATAPNPITNREFTQAFGRALHRPAVIPMPGVLLSLALGEMAREMLLQGQRVLPRKALNAGFTFRYEDIDSAMAAAVRN